MDDVFAEAAGHLIDLVVAARREFGEVPIATVGGIWNIPRVNVPFTAAVAATAADEPPAVGAAWYALAGQGFEVELIDDNLLDVAESVAPARPAL